jgi:hypothetical protein
MAISLETITLIDNATLTASYLPLAADNLELNVEKVTQITLDVFYTTGAAETNNTIELKVEFANTMSNRTSPVTGDWVQETTISASGGTTTVTPNIYQITGASATTTYPVQIAVPMASRFIRVSVKESGVAANFGTVTVKCTMASDNLHS